MVIIKFTSVVNLLVKSHQHLSVKVTEVDEDRKRIQLTMVI
ncbi:S1 RNA-binding domain-containing protein [Flavobacterium ovatum]